MTPETTHDLKKLDVAEDSELRPEEKQVSLTTTKRDTSFRVHSEVSTVTAYLRDHPAAEMVDYRVEDGELVAITADIPRGLVDLKAKPRNTDQFGRLVTTAELRERDGDG